MMGRIVLTMLFIIPWIIGAESQKFVIIAASYNNEQWCEKHLTSIFQQTYPHWRLIYINDCSTDATHQIVQEVTSEYQVQDKVQIRHNKKRMGHLYNQYHAIHSCRDDEIVVVLDGDDWFAHDEVLSLLNDVYSHEDVWITYGSYEPVIQAPVFCHPIPDYVIQENGIRNYSWVTSHLRTFYAGLYKLINKKDLFFKGTFFPVSTDVASMIPMIEMAAERHKFIKKVLLVYNNNTALNLDKGNKPLYRACNRSIKRQKKYTRLSRRPF